MKYTVTQLYVLTNMVLKYAPDMKHVSAEEIDMFILFKNMQKNGAVSMEFKAMSEQFSEFASIMSTHG